MADSAKTWQLIHTERAALADTLATLTPEQWATPSLCGGWTVKQLAAHVMAGAEQTPAHFLTGMLVNGFRFNAMMQRDVRGLGALDTREIVDRIRRRTTTTNRPPAPVLAMLGEVVVHGEDIRRPLGLAGTVSAPATVACLEMYRTASFPVGGRKRIRGLRLVATDVDWTSGDGPEVRGPGLPLVLAMTGRPAGLDALGGAGLPVLQERLGGPSQP
jgi:uncharacterized protein (TIGR03083 family)